MPLRLGVIGDPIAHSRSPQLHERGLELAGLQGSSVRLRLGDGEAGVIAEIMGRDYDALSVTMPLKESARRFCTRVTPTAQRLGVVNSLKWVDGHIEGACTDGAGLVAALEHECQARIAGATAVVLGSGGSARAIIDAFLAAGAQAVSVVARNDEAVRALQQHYPTLQRGVTEDMVADIIVNTTPSEGRTESTGHEYERSAGAIAVDITYEPIRSQWRAAHEDAGFRTMNGLAMLAYQAALQMEWWWGVSIEGHELLKVLQ